MSGVRNELADTRNLTPETLSYGTKMALTEPYQPATDAEVTFSDGTHRRLSDLWEKHPLLLVFLRHFG